MKIGWGAILVTIGALLAVSIVDEVFWQISDARRDSVRRLSNPPPGPAVQNRP